MKVELNKIYLAGGLKSNWQEIVEGNLSDQFIFFNPRNHGLETDSKYYTVWDIHHIKKCDIMFGYMEASNPFGYGLALEIGYARALNKTIILVNDKSKVDDAFDRYFKIVENLADIVFENLDDAIDFLRRFSN